MKVQDVNQSDNPTEITFSRRSVRGVSGYSSAINVMEKNVTETVISVDNNTCMRYGGKVEQFRKTIKTNNRTIRLFWFDGRQSSFEGNIFKAI